MHSQKYKTQVIYNTCNPVWNDEITLSIKDLDLPVKLVSDVWFHYQLYLVKLENAGKICNLDQNADMHFEIQTILYFFLHMLIWSFFNI